MARIEDGELLLEIEGASEEQVSHGLAAARQHLQQSGVNLRAAFAAQERADEAGQVTLQWEQGLVDEPGEVGEADEELVAELGEAWFLAVRAAGFDPAEEMVIGKFDLVREPPVLRDLFEPVS